MSSATLSPFEVQPFSAEDFSKREKQGKPIIVMTDDKDNGILTSVANSFGKLPDHLLIEIFIRVPVSEWAQISCVKKKIVGQLVSWRMLVASYYNKDISFG